MTLCNRNDVPQKATVSNFTVRSLLGGKIPVHQKTRTQNYSVISVRDQQTKYMIFFFRIMISSKCWM